jgi:hypothetical protein
MDQIRKFTSHMIIELNYLALILNWLIKVQTSTNFTRATFFYTLHTFVYTGSYSQIYTVSVV